MLHAVVRKIGNVLLENSFNLFTFQKLTHGPTMIMTMMMEKWKNTLMSYQLRLLFNMMARWCFIWALYYYATICMWMLWYHKKLKCLWLPVACVSCLICFFGVEYENIHAMSIWNLIFSRVNSHVATLCTWDNLTNKIKLLSWIQLMCHVSLGGKVQIENRISIEK